MPSNEELLGTAVVSLLNAQTDWGCRFTAERVYVPDWDLAQELKDLKVNVFVQERQVVTRDRSSRAYRYGCGVAFAKRLKADQDTKELDGLMYVSEQVSTLIEAPANRVLTVSGGRRFQMVGQEDRPRFDPQLLAREGRTGFEPATHAGSFLSLVFFTYLWLN